MATQSSDLSPIVKAAHSAGKIDRHRLEPLTTFRFFAAALVFLNHFGRKSLSATPAWVQEMLLHGRDAVVFFFLLSGFVLAYNYIDISRPTGQRTNWRTFWLVRFARIYPAYLLALLIPLPRKIAGFMHGSVNSSEFLNLPLVLCLVQAWFPSEAGAWNPPAWSLSVEAFLYASFPIIAQFTRGLSDRVLLCLGVPAVVAAEALRTVIAYRSPELALYCPLLYLPVFILGVTLGRSWLQGSPRLMNGNLLFVIVGLCIFAVLARGTLFLGSFKQRSLLILLFAAVILAGAASRGRLNRLLSQPLLVLLGNASYVFYIIHMPFMVGVQRAWALVDRGMAVDSSITVLIVGFSATVIASILIHRFFEGPVRHLILVRAGIERKPPSPP